VQSAALLTSRRAGTWPGGLPAEGPVPGRWAGHPRRGAAQAACRPRLPRRRPTASRLAAANP